MNLHYQNLIFDLGNVIIDIDYELTYNALIPLFKENQARDMLKNRVDELTLKYEQGLISTELFLNQLMRDMHPDTHAKIVIDAWNAMLLDIPEKRLRHLKNLSHHYRIIFLSNTNPLHIDWVNKYLQKVYSIDSLHELSPDVFYSHEVQDRKPNISIFQLILSEFDLDARKTLFFDDNLSNVAAAYAAGIHAVHSPAETEIIEQTACLFP